MRTPIALALLTLSAASAQAAPADAKKLAPFDLGYAKCESLFPAMRGHRDQAYLALWKVKLDAKSSAGLAKLRKSETYRLERQKAVKAMDKSAGPEIEAKLKQQCEATWAEARRINSGG